MAKDIHEKIRDIGIKIPELPKPKFSYIPGVITGNLAYVSGQTPTKEGTLIYRGKVGGELELEDGYEAARLAAINCVAELKLVLGDLNRVKRIVNVSGYVACAEGFVKQPAVVNGASDLIVEIWGEEGKHSRKAVGVYELPDGAPVEVELIAEIK
jgi:enamine deaminase RidA (YjgF/YER057c/UK114 family)